MNGTFFSVIIPSYNREKFIQRTIDSILKQTYQNFEIIEASVENCLREQLKNYERDECIAIIDPPRKGLAEAARKSLCESKNLKQLLYLSCNPESLIHDLKDFLRAEWIIEQVIPFDFFPKTKHLETLVFLRPEE